MERLFAAIGRGVVRRRKMVIAAWVVFLVAGLFFAPRIEGVFSRGASLGTRARRSRRPM